MKAYQMLIPAVLCLLAVLLARSEALADDELRKLNDKLFEITKELERRLEAKQMTEPEFFVDADHKRGVKPRTYDPLNGHRAFIFGKRAEDGAQTDRTMKTRSQKLSSFIGNTAFGYGKRAEYLPEDLLALQDVVDDFDPYDDLPAKKNRIRTFTKNTGLSLGKRNADETDE